MRNGFPDSYTQHTRFSLWLRRIPDHKKMPADLATTTTTTSPTVAAMCGGRKYHHYINRPVPQSLLRLQADPSLIVSPLPPPTATAAPPNPKADNRRERFLHYPTCYD
ncbi:uncharacterized protein LOC129737917 [Uranotaenia lowii]|uniref:uncharacterized protein LOC129737917 n=1 Tax=Uranotaenia lowii TaxID=190385 RepID=UPI002478FDE8|nr:uncharacterized protein LOC129737917 [Uranotaenia lowii]